MQRTAALSDFCRANTGLTLGAESYGQSGSWRGDLGLLLIDLKRGMRFAHIFLNPAAGRHLAPVQRFMTARSALPVHTTTAGARAWCLQHRSSDVDEQAAVQSNWALHYEQVSAGRFEGELTLAQLPGLRLVAESASLAVRQVGDIGVGSYGFALTDAQPGEAFFNGQPLSTQTMMVGRGDSLDMLTPAGCRLLGIVVEHELLSGLWQQLYQRPLAQWLERQVVVELPAQRAAEVRQLQRLLLERLQHMPQWLDDPRTVQQLRDEVLMAWIEAIPGRPDMDGLKTAEARKRLVDKACALTLAQPDQPMTMLALCRDVGASPRKLAYCFREVLGTSPARYLRAVRLNGVRRGLKQPSSAALGVHDVATRWGFWNLGEFAGDYRRQFGELPSETLRRARQGLQLN